jgi:amino acid permease
MAHTIQAHPYPAENNSSDEGRIGSNEKNVYRDTGIGGGYRDDPEHHLQRGLKSRQITMIAIGGAIGTGLIVGTSVFHPVPPPTPMASRIS